MHGAAKQLTNNVKSSRQFMKNESMKRFPEIITYFLLRYAVVEFASVYEQ